MMTEDQMDVDVVVLTALALEHDAVQAHLNDCDEIVHPLGTIYTVGSFRSSSRVLQVAIVEIGAGNMGAAVEAERAIAFFTPYVALFVGVAGGIKDVLLGDVVAATKIYNHESGKSADEFLPRPVIGESSYSLEQRARVVARYGQWRRRIILDEALDRDPIESRPQAYVAPIAAGEKVITSTKSAVWIMLRKNYSDAIAVEMEGVGFLTATRAHTGTSSLVVRGVSDLIDDKETADAFGWQQHAARNAAAFAFEVLATWNSTPRTEQELDSTSDREPNSPTHLRRSCPYPGLRAFREIDNQWFHGRESLVDRTLQKLASLQEAHATPRLLALIGPSGSGKTSLIQAGILPNLYTVGYEPKDVVVLKLGPDPILSLGQHLFLNYQIAESIEECLEKIDGDARVLACSLEERARTLIVVDHFEALLADLARSHSAKTVVSQLLYCATTQRRRITVLVSLRPDRIAEALVNAELSTTLSECQVFVGPLTYAELILAIEQPARQIGRKLEVGLGPRIASTALESASPLPFVQHVMRLLWFRQRRGVISHDAYEQLGGVTGALVKHAEETYRGFDHASQELCRSIFLRLCNFDYSSGGLHSARTATRSDLLSDSEQVGQLDRLLAVLAGDDTRLLTLEQDHNGNQLVRVSHEVLLRQWPRVTAWSQEERGREEARRQLEQAAREWDDNERQEKYVQASIRLTELIGIAHSLSPCGEDFVHASISAWLRGALSVDVDLLELELRSVMLSMPNSLKYAQKLLEEDISDIQRRRLLAVLSCSEKSSYLLQFLDSLKGCPPKELLHLRTLCCPPTLQVLSDAWKLVSPQHDNRLAGLAVLVHINPLADIWDEHADYIVHQLLALDAVSLGMWVALFRGVSQHLRPAFTSVLHEIAHPKAIAIICKYYKFDAELLALCIKACNDQEGQLCVIDHVRQQSQQFQLKLSIELSKTDNDNAYEQARAAVGELLLGNIPACLQIVDGSTSQDAITAFIHEVIRRRIAGPVLSQALFSSTLARTKSTMTLLVGVRQHRGDAEFNEYVIPFLLDVYENSNVLVVRAAAGWALRNWGLSSELHRIDESLVGNLPAERDWFLEKIAGKFLTFRICPPGTFRMGSPDEEQYREENEALHTTTISQAFAIADHPTTLRQYERFVEETAREISETTQRGSRTQNACLVGITRQDASAFCAWASGQRVDEYRLPTETEWEHACRAGAQSPYSFGADPVWLSLFAWYEGNSSKAAQPPKLLFPNPWGLFDMHGNVWEWCTNDFTPYDSKTEQPETTPQRGVLRGGGWYDSAKYCRSAYRNDVQPTTVGLNLGFRMACTIK